MRSLILVAALAVTFLSCKKTGLQTAPPAELPKVKITKLNNPTEGTILIAPYKSGDQSSGYLYILDKNGNITTSVKTASYPINFKRWVIGNKIRYTYSENSPTGFHIADILYVPSQAVVLDENLKEINRFNFLPANGRPDDQSLLDSHDFILLDDNHYIAMSYYEKTVTNIPTELNPAPGVKVAAPIIQEVQDGQVIWEWDATNYPELYSSSKEWNNFSDATKTQDYAHMNSLFIDPKDNNLLISLRNLNEVIKVNRTSGDIMWRLGGIYSDFPLTADQQMLRQHNATLTDDGETLLVFDNGEATERPLTRILEFQLDEDNKQVTSFKALPVPNNVFSQYMGSVQKRGDTYMIGGGTGNYIMEVNSNTGEILFQAQLDEPTYRAFKY